MTQTDVEVLYMLAVLADLEGVDFLEGFSEDRIAAAYNGIGPSSMSEKDRKRLTKWLKVFESACLIHDMRYEVSDGTRFSFNRANMELRENCLKLANYEYKWYDWRRYRARFVARALYAAVCTPIAWKVWVDCAAGDGSEKK